MSNDAGLRAALAILRAAALPQPAVRLEAEAAPGISCPSCDGEGSCTICGGGGRIMSLDLATQPAENAKGGEVVASNETDETGKPTEDSDPWFQLGWHKERLEWAESELQIWKDRAMSLRLAHPPATQPTGDEPVGLREAAEEVCNRAFDHYRARNGRMCSIEGDDGEKCWIIPYDAMEDLRAALATPARPDTVSFVQEWLLSGDHEADQWHKDFAAAIDARQALTTPARTDDASTGSHPAPVDQEQGQ